MRYNGLCLVIEMATAKLDRAVVHRYRQALLLGALREDYWYLRGLGVVVESLSIEHFFGPGLPGGFIPLLSPSARGAGTRLYRKALKEAAAGRLPAAFVLLGRCAHLLSDMACPVHVHRVAHLNDPYEWYVEGNRAALSQQPVPPPPEGLPVPELFVGLMRHTAQFAGDGTSSLHGRWLKKLGLRKALSRLEVAAQARAIIPVAASYNAALFANFLRDSGIEYARSLLE
jgi:hypothetical protein